MTIHVTKDFVILNSIRPDIAHELDRARGHLPGGRLAEHGHAGEVWEYRGTEYILGQWLHKFEHGRHPATNNPMHYRVPCEIEIVNVRKEKVDEKPRRDSASSGADDTGSVLTPRYHGDPNCRD